MIKHLILKLSVKHIYGPLNIRGNDSSLIVLCVVKNGEYYVHSFLKHYFDLGAKHVVFLDNGSTDDTVRIAKKNKNVTILQTHLPYKGYQRLMQKYLIKKYGKRKWSLNVDIDEFFDYPCSNILSLENFIGYLNSKSYNAVITQRLEMFSDEKIFKNKKNSKKFSKRNYLFYDLENISKKNYAQQLQLFITEKPKIGMEKDIKFYSGGIRRTVFKFGGWLTKTALIFLDDNITPLILTHFVNNAKIADISCVLYHYYFTCNYYKKILRVIHEKNFQNLRTYLSAKRLFEKEQEIIIKRPTSRKLNNVNQLVEEGFLSISDDFSNWVRGHEGKKM